MGNSSLADTCVYVYVYMDIRVCTGKGGEFGDYTEYYEVVHSMKVIFGWYTPDDNMVSGFGV